ncbi:MAG: hypothetical protein FJ297_11375 [Planctomycetes bacterium]|nr:hypothetical protein [Planctomycetota bacterium]
MIQFRPFSNQDPPRLLEVWNSEPPVNGIARLLGVPLLEQFVLSKLYFDHHGLILAEEWDGADRRVVGFAHAGFGPNADGSWIGTDVGVVAMVMVRPRDDEDRIAAELVSRCEQFVRAAGARSVCAGGLFPTSPFYQGVHGGSQPAGILASDARRTRWMAAAGYQPGPRRHILQLRLADLCPVADRQQLMIRRRYRIEAVVDPPPRTWWEANRVAQHDHLRYQLTTTPSGAPAAIVDYVSIDPLSATWGIRAAGILSIERADGCEEGIETYLLCESLRELKSTGLGLVEIHLDEHDDRLPTLLERVGFRNTDTGVLYRKQWADG